MIDRARIAEQLRSDYGHPLSVVAETGSTNDDAKGAPHGAVFIADSQTKGRGRGGKRWHSPPGHNIYLSMVLHLPPDPRLSLMAGLALAEVVDRALVEPRAMIKWPNDIYVDAQKIGGILVEASAAEVVIGVGLNVLGERFPDDFAVPATSLKLCAAQHLDRALLCAQLIDAIGARRELDLTELRARDFLLGKRVHCGDVEGVAGGIDEQGRLIVDGRPIVSGEVTWQTSA